MFLNTSDGRVPLKSGDVVTITPEKRYIIDRYLASGGFALLYIAHQEGSDRYVALKEFYPRTMADAYIQRLDDGKVLVWNPFSEFGSDEFCDYQSQGSAYFRREAELTRRAGRVFDQDGKEELQNHADILRAEGPMEDIRGNLYLAVDTFQGESLRSFVERGFLKNARGEVLSNQFLNEIIDILKQTTLRLSGLHDSAGIYHLDLSADNIYLALTAGGTRRQPYIIDYGSAYDRENEAEQVDHRYTVNPHSAPEVLALAELQKPNGDYQVNESSDTYSLVSILFYAVTGQIFTAEERLYSKPWREKILRNYSAGLQEFHGTSSFADRLIKFFEQGLSADQSMRFATAKELLAELEKLEEAYSRYGNLLPLVSGDDLMSYLVLEKHPLYRYRDEKGGIHVLCLGSGVFVRRMVLSMISCGQIIGCQLHIHIVSNMPKEDYLRDLLTTAPALVDYANLGENPRECYVNFTYDRVEDVLDPRTCREVLDRYSAARYLLISLGKNRKNVMAMERYAQELMARSPGEDRETIINYYAAEDAANTAMPSRIREKLPRWLKTDAFSENLAGYTSTLQELGMRTLKLAHLYNRLGNPRIALAESADPLMKDAYAQHSSCASALHLKYKLAGVGIDPEEMSMDQIIDAYGRALSGSGKGLLLQNEHRRWIMFMISRGYRFPTDQEIRKYGFEMVDGGFNRRWRCDARYLHPCLVPCDEKGIGLNHSHWEQSQSLKAIDGMELDELDRMSLKLNLFAREKCRAILKQDILKDLFRQIRKKLPDHAAAEAENIGKAKLADLKELLEKVESVVCSSAEVLQFRSDFGMLARLQQECDNAGINVESQIVQLQQNLRVFTEYASQVDYKAPDLTIIQNLLWLLYGCDELTLIKLKGRSIADDITGALILEPKKVVWLGMEEMPYWRQFLKDHGSDAQIEFIPQGAADADGWYEILDELVSVQSGQIVIDCTGAEEAAVVAAYRVSQALPQAGVIRSCPDGTIENIHNFAVAAAYTMTTEISAEEIYKLQGASRGARDNDYMQGLGDLVPALWQLYREYPNVQNQMTWKMITAFFYHNRSKAAAISLQKKYLPENALWNAKSYIVGRDKWYGLRIEDVFRKMEDSGLVRNLKTEDMGPLRVKVSFVCPEELLAKPLDRFIRYRVPQLFAPVKCEIKETLGKFDINVEDGYVVDLYDNGIDFSDKRKGSDRKRYEYAAMFPILTRMEELGLIFDLKYSENPTKINFVYRNPALRECLSQEGNVLELYIWNEARRMHCFDDVQANFFFRWKELEGADASEKPVENELDVIATRGLRSLIISAKTAKMNKEHLYEIKFLTDKFSLNSKAVIVYSSDKAFVDGMPTEDLSTIFSRAKAMGVCLIQMKPDVNLGEELMKIALE